MTIDVAGESVTLHGGKALVWPAARTVFIADTHWGKADSFRALGVAVPSSLPADLARLGGILTETLPERLVILGDLFHDRNSKSADVAEVVRAWRRGFAELAIDLIRGNHDDRAGDPPDDWDFAVADEPVQYGPFAARHYPEPTTGLYTLAGHLHPGVTIHGRGRQKLKLPCFHFGEAVGILPAFGSFTGLADVRAAGRVFAVAEGEVVRV